MNNNRCIVCDEIIPEGKLICPKCELKIHNRYRETPQTLIDVKRELWVIASKNGIMINNQNIDWLLDQVYRELVK